MRPLARTALVAAASFAAARAGAQRPTLHVLNHLPTDSAGSGAVVLVTFDHPIAGALDRSVDAANIFRMSPTIRGTLGWRDPATIRFVPDAPLVPGTTFRVTIDTSFAAIDGARLAEPFSFSFRVPGPRLLRFAPTAASGEQNLARDGILSLLFSAPVSDTSLSKLARGARLELANCNLQLPLHVIGQRPVDSTTRRELRFTHTTPNDTAGDGFRRVVDLAPGSLLPEDCNGTVTMPSLDVNARDDVWRYDVATITHFRLESPFCSPRIGCDSRSIYITFSAPIHRADFLKYVSITPATPFEVAASEANASYWMLKGKFTPGIIYTIHASPELHDISGRAIMGNTVDYPMADLQPTLAYRGGLVTTPKGRAFVRLRFANVDSATMIVRAIPDDARVRWLAGIGSPAPNGLPAPNGSLADSVVRVIALHAPFNVERDTLVQVPRVPGHEAQLRAVTFAIRARPRPPQRVTDKSNKLLVSVYASRDWDSGLPFAPRLLLLQTSDILLHSKIDDRRGLVFVTNARTGAPVSSAAVTMYDSTGAPMADGRTDATGVADLVSRPGRRFSDALSRRGSGYAGYIEATTRDQRSVSPLTSSWFAGALAPWSLGAPWMERQRPVAALYTERGIYRPGETVHLSAIVRDGILGALTTPVGDSLRLRIVSQVVGADVSDTIFSATSRLSEFGTATDSIRLDERVHLGQYEATIELYRRGQWLSVERQWFRVAEYRVPEFTVSATIDSGVVSVRDTINVHVGANYLFGAPMARAIVQWSMRGDESPSVSIPGTAGYVIGSWDWYGQQRRHSTPVQHGVDTLDESGRARIAVVPNLDSLTLPVQVTVDVAITDINRQVITSSARRVVHTSTLYIAAREAKQAWYWRVGAPDSLRLLVVRPTGARVAGTRVDVAFIRHGWDFLASGTRQTSDTVARLSTVSDTSPVALSFTPKLGGNYEARFTARDENGRPVVTSLFAYALGGSVADPNATGLRVAMVAPTGTLHVGDTATVAYTNPFPTAEAWITVEREGVLEQRRATVGSGTHQIKLTITEHHAPSVYVSVLLVNHASVFASDSLQRVTRIGYATIRVDPSVKRLTVELSPSTRLAGPSDSITLSIRLADGRRGVRGEVAIWAADEGVLGLTGYATPNPLSSIYRMRGIGTVVQLLTPTALNIPPPVPDAIRLRGLASSVNTLLAELVVTSSTAAASGPIEVSTRSAFRSTAFFVGRVVTDDSGRGSVRVKLPDNLTTFRLMAVAVTAGDRYGSADDSLLVTRPLVARPALPRFVRTGDTLVAGAAINVRSGRSLEATVTSTVTGLTTSGSPTVQIMTDGHGAEARWRYVVPQTDSAGSNIKFHFSASSTDGNDAVESTLPVRAAYIPRTHTLAGVVRGSSIIHFDLPAGIDPARSRLSLESSGSPLGIMRWAYQFLVAYPYDCTEQISSNGRALVALYRARNTLNVATPLTGALSASPVAKLQALVDVLSKRQNADGGIRYWNVHQWTTPWLTANAGMFLLEARAIGVVVDQRVVDGVARYLTASLRDHSFLTDTLDGTRADRTVRLRGWLGQRLAAAMYLSSSGSPDIAAEDDLKSFASRMSWEDRVWLANALAKRDPALARRMLDDAWRAVAVAGKRVDFPDSTLGAGMFASHVRPVARLLQTTFLLEPDHPLLGALLETMLQLGRAQRGWAWNTQDYSSAIVAATMISKEQGETAQRGVSVRAEGGGASGRVLLSRTSNESAVDSSVSLDGLVRDSHGGVDVPLVITGGGATSPLFYALTITEIPKTQSTTPDLQGMFVERWYERYDTGAPVTSVEEGDLVRVRLRVTVPGDRQFVALDDALPAGLEAVDLSLRTSATLGPFASETATATSTQRERDTPTRFPPYFWGYGNWDQGWWSPWENRELRDDRVVYFARMLGAGTYSVSYVARATTAGVFVRPPAQAQEMYNAALHGRTEGGTFTVREKPGGRR